jgi:hypothetical protein
MSKPLNRPMFRMGGSPNTNSGIVSGFAQPRKNFSNGNPGYMPAGFVGSQEEDDILAETLGTSTSTSTPTPSTSTFNADAQKELDLIDQEFMAQKPSGLSTSDWLRIAAAGGKILGAEGRGPGLKGALAAAGPALGELGEGLATSADAREAVYQKQLSEQRAAKLGALGRQTDRSFQADESGKTRAFEEMKFLREIDSGKYETDYSRLLDERASAKQDMLDAISKQDEQAYKEAAQRFDSTFPEEQDVRARMYREYSGSDEFGRFTDAANEIVTSTDARPKRFEGKTEAEIAEMLFDEYMDRNFPSPIKPEYKAEGGRVGYANGSGPYEPGSGPDPDPGSPPIMRAQQTGITFQELRARLPKEVSDSVVKLLATSEVALLDFANIATQEDMIKFNQKYNSDLQLPAQGA